MAHEKRHLNKAVQINACSSGLQGTLWEAAGSEGTASALTKPVLAPRRAPFWCAWKTSGCKLPDQSALALVQSDLYQFTVAGRFCLWFPKPGCEDPVACWPPFVDNDIKLVGWIEWLSGARVVRRESFHGNIWDIIGHWQSQKGPINPHSFLMENKSWTGAGPSIKHSGVKCLGKGGGGNKDVADDAACQQQGWHGPAVSRTAIKQTSLRQGLLFKGCSAHVWGSGSISFWPEHLCPTALLSPASWLRRSYLTWGGEVTAPCWSRAIYLWSKQQPLCEEAAGDYTKQDKPSDLCTVRAGHSLLFSAKGCLAVVR